MEGVPSEKIIFHGTWQPFPWTEDGMDDNHVPCSRFLSCSRVDDAR